MDEMTAGKLLAILDNYSEPTSVGHVLVELQELIVESTICVGEALAAGDDPEPDLRDLRRYTKDLEKLVLLLHEVRS